MLYVDTCVLLALLLPETHSQAATRFLEEANATLAISPWSATELLSALGLKVRSGALNLEEAETVLQSYERILAPALLMLEVEPQDFRNANACLRGWPTALRAADALHLAIAAGRGATCAAWTPPLWQRPSVWGSRPSCSPWTSQHHERSSRGHLRERGTPTGSTRPLGRSSWTSTPPAGPRRSTPLQGFTGCEKLQADHIEGIVTFVLISMSL